MVQSYYKERWPGGITCAYGNTYEEDKRGRDRPNNKWIDRTDNDTKVVSVTV